MPVINIDSCGYHDEEYSDVSSLGIDSEATWYYASMDVISLRPSEYSGLAGTSAVGQGGIVTMTYIHIYTDLSHSNGIFKSQQ